MLLLILVPKPLDVDVCDGIPIKVKQVNVWRLDSIFLISMYGLRFVMLRWVFGRCRGATSRV